MLCSDAGLPSGGNVFSDVNLSTINLEVVSEIQKELATCDLISLVFLLYDVPDTALQRLIVLQRVSKDIEGNHLDLLHQWALHAQTKPTWKQQLLEALAVCQLFSILKKLGCSIPAIKERYSSYDPCMNSYINPIKIILYKLCENMTSSTFNNFKKTLDSFEFSVSVMQYDTCELVFLELMSQKFISVNHTNYERETISIRCNIEKIATIIDRYSELNHFATMLRDLEKKLNNRLEIPSTSAEATETKSNLNTKDCNYTKPEDLNEIYDLIEQLRIEDLPIDLKSDQNALPNDRYLIKKKDRVGICCIINQEVFHPSRDSIERRTAKKPLETRTGSTKDKIMLEKTMRSLNFDIMTKENLNRKEMIAFIQEVIQKRVSKDDSIFMLCILSHGIRGHVYAADSVAVRVDYIQNMLDDALSLHGIPKVLILQACQVEADDDPPAFAADGPQYTLRKMDFLVYWATSPELEAYRSEKLGSLFIQILCGTIMKFGQNEHLFDLFTKVTNKVTEVCAKRKCDQVPIFKSTLRKKLFLHVPTGHEDICVSENLQ